MAALFFFDRMLPVPLHQRPDRAEEAMRQVEVFTHGNQLFIRMRKVNHENSGEDEYTAALSHEDARQLIEGIEGGNFYLGGGASDSIAPE